MKKIFLMIPVFLFFLACSGKSLLTQNQSPNLDTTQNSSITLAQISISPLQNGAEFEIPNYRIHLEQAGMVITKIQFLQESAPANLRAHHAGEEHGEPEEEDSSEEERHAEPASCDHQGSLNNIVFLNLTRETFLPCIQMAGGHYTGLQFIFAKADEHAMGMHGSIHLEGHAVSSNTQEEYPFHMHAELNDTLQIPAEIHLESGNHHVEIKINLASWFHGFDFSILEQIEGKVLLDVSHNENRFEHMLEHMRESFSFE